jgi:aspartate aminotransferase
MTLVSRRFQELRPSSTVALAGLARRMAAEGRDIVDFSEGESDFDTPEHVVEAAIAAMRRGETRYTNVSGTDRLKEAIRRKFLRDNGLDFAREQVTVGTGAKQVIFNAFMASLEPGDEVIVPAPYWVSYPDMIRIAGGTAILVPTEPRHGFKLVPDALRRVLSPRTRWLVLCSPGNPAGAVYRAEECSALAEILADWPRVGVLSDDIYEHLVYAPARFTTFAAAASALRDRILTVNGVSKTYAMTGWRIGYGGGPADLIAAMNVLQGQSTTHATSIAQAAAVAALDGPQDMLDRQRATMRARRDHLVPRIQALTGLDCASPEGAFYLWVECGGVIGRRTPSGAILADDRDLAGFLIENQGIVTVPGTAFGQPGFLRVCFAKPIERLDTLTQRLAAAIAALA